MPDGMTALDGSNADEANAREADSRARDRGERAPAPTGKPYMWQLATAENPELIALPPEAIAAPLSHAITFHRSIVERTAAFLIVVSRNNGYEGRDPSLITDDLACGTVADMLGFDIDVLGLALRDLQERGLVACEGENNLRLKDIEALDRVSEGL